MNFPAFKYRILSWTAALTIWIIVLMPFHAFLTVWLSSELGHYTALRLWKEILLILCSVAALFLLATDKKIRSQTLTRRLVWLIFAYMFVTVIWGLIALHRGAVDGVAMGLGIVENLRFLAFFLITWSVSLRLSRLHTYWQWMVLWPAAIVVGFGVLQFLVLPHNFLASFGYGPDTIRPYQTINNNLDYIRVISTLRGANPLGAYLVIPITMLSVLLIQKRIEKKQAVLLGFAFLCLLFSFSRSAWIGVSVSLAVVALISLKTRRAKKIAITVGASVVILLGASFGLLRQNDTFENIFFHTQEESSIQETSNDGHTAALKTGLNDVIYKPLGTGTGTAGPASIHNDSCPARISENYFLQIGQETGWIGLGLFILINTGIGYLLWLRRSDPLALSLLASLAGITVISMLSHAWADDTLAYIWWGLAGIAMAPNLKKAHKSTSIKSKK